MERAYPRNWRNSPQWLTWLYCTKPDFSCDFDARANSVSVAFDADHLKQNPMVCCLSLWCCKKQFGTITNGGYNHINLAVRLLRSPNAPPTMSGTNLHIRPGLRRATAASPG